MMRTAIGITNLYSVLLMVTIAIAVTAAPGYAAPQADFYVSPIGNDAWSGRLDRPNDAGTDGPFATIHRARDAVRADKANAGAPKPYTVLIRGGTYRLEKPIVFEPTDSGQVDAAITYAAYPDEKPIFSGGSVITGWKKAGDGVWTTEVPEVKAGKWYFHQLFVDGQRRTRARTPNKGYLHTDGPLPQIKDPHKERKNKLARMGFRYKPGDLKKWNNLEDVNLFVYHSWTASVNWIARLDEKKHEVHFTAPSNWPIGYWQRKQRYYVENYRDALDAPGEWYLDRKTGVLHYRPLPGEDMGKVEVVAPRLRKLVRFVGDADGEKFVEHIRLEGLSFQHADWFVADRGPADGQAAAWLEAAVFAQGTNHCALVDCEIAHVGEYGLYLERGCKHNLVQRCHVHDLGAGGVRIGHMSTPKSDAWASEHNIIDNSFIHDGGHVFRAGVGVWIGKASHNRVTHNEICDFDYTGLSVGWSWGYADSTAHHNLFAFNHVHHIGNGVLSDMGGIYSLGVSPGTAVRNNCFHDIISYAYGGWGLYTDEGSTGIVMENNIVYNTKTGGFHQHYGKENIVRNNILAYSSMGQIQRSREEDHLSFTFENNIVYFDNGSLLSGTWKNDKFKMDRNVYWDTSAPEIVFAGNTLEQWRRRGHDKNSIIADPKFVDPARRDFRLKPDSPALKLGFTPIDRDVIGLYGSADWVNRPKGVPHRKSQWLPPGPTRVDDGFETTDVGAKASGATTSEENDQATIRVTGETAAGGGKRSLKFIDQPGQKQSFNPHLFYSPHLRKGDVVGRFDLFRRPGATLYHEWRDNHSPYRVGPSLWITADGQLKASGKVLMTLPAEAWVRFEIRCGLGGKSDGTYDLTVTVGDGKPKRFADLPCGNAKFRRLDWYGFVAQGQTESTFYLDNVKLGNGDDDRLRRAK